MGVYVVVLGDGMVADSGRGGAVVNDPPVPQDDSAIDQGCQQSTFVQDEQYRCAVRAQPGKSLGERTLVGDVDPGHRFVEDEQLGPGGKGAGDENSLLLSAGEPGHAFPRPLGKAHGRQSGVDGGAIAFAQPAEGPAVSEPAGGDDLADRRGYAGCGRRSLRDVPDLPPFCEPRQGCTEEASLAGREWDQTDQGSDKRRFSRAVRPEDRHHIAVEHGDRHMPQDHPATEDDHATVELSHEGRERTVPEGIPGPLFATGGVVQQGPSAFLSASRFACMTLK